MRLLCLFILLSAFSLSRDFFVSSDEAVNLQMVKNMQMNPGRFISRPSYDPGGHSSWENESMSHVLMTPVFHYLLLGFDYIFPGNLIKSAAFLQVLLLGLLVFFLYYFKGFDVASLFFSFLTLSVFSLSYLLQIEHETMMTVFGLLSILFADQGIRKKNILLIALSGIFLGISFLAKLWLCGPFGLGLIFMLINSIKNKDLEKLAYVKFSFVLITSFLLTSFSHLAFVWAFSPGDLSTWLNNVYFGVVTGAGDYGSKAGKGGWEQPFYYYFYIVCRDMLSLMPVFFVTFSTFLKKRSWSNLEAALVITFLSFIPLSFIGTKEPLYILPSCVSILMLITLRFNEVSIKNRQFFKICGLLGLVYIAFWGIVKWARFSNTLNFNFFTLSFIAAILCLAFIYLTSVRKVKVSILLFLLITSLAPVYNQIKMKRHFLPVIDFIKNNEVNFKDKDPRVTYIVADNYSYFGYFLWNRVMTYRWLSGGNGVSKEGIIKLMKKSDLRYFILNKNDLDLDEIKQITKSTNSSYRLLGQSLVIYK